MGRTASRARCGRRRDKSMLHGGRRRSVRNEAMKSRSKRIKKSSQRARIADRVVLESATCCHLWHYGSRSRERSACS
jgi:hypothetical protein